METRIKYGFCPLHNSKSISPSLSGDCSKNPLYEPVLPAQIQWMNFGKCKYQFVDGYFTEDTLEIIFQKTLDNQKVGFQLEKQRKVSSQLIEKVLPHKSSGTSLDIGFGNGSLFFTALEFGFDAVGVDLRKDSVDAMKRLGLQAHYQLLETVEFDKAIFVVSMLDVLEHIIYPKDVLTSLILKWKRWMPFNFTAKY